MESNLNNRDFEQFVKQNADQYRMFPSEKVWAGVDKALHTRRKWYGLSLGLLLLLTGAGVTWVMITTPVNKDLKTSVPITLKNRVREIKNSQPIVSGTNHSPIVVNNNVAEPIAKSSIPFHSFPSTDVFTDQPAKATSLENGPDLIAITTTRAITNRANFSEQKLQATSFVVSPLHLIDRDAWIASVDKPTSVEEISIDKTAAADLEVIKKEFTSADIIYPWTIESVVNSFKITDLKKRVSLQFYLAPTVSYRKLSENKAFLRDAAAVGSVPNYSAYYVDLKNVVTHKPDIGLELGLSAKYPITRTLKLKAGLQFNVTRYDIRAYSSPSEIATIALDANPGINSISRETTYRTRTGSNANWLQNLYYSASAPLGIELKLSQGKKTSFSIASTIQPTYVISDKAYLVSTDFKNYMEVPKSILRRLNFNTGFEALVGYSTKNYNWQIGPQIRYQIRSSFRDQYPVKENLFDFGLKVGVMLNK
ncbi:MAG TPA: hypothetical protein VF487_10780 [Chitinophagaceae bacterium]